MEVKIYSTPNCPWCRRTKEFMNSHGVKFKSIDVSNDRKAAHEMISKSGQTGVPVIEIDDKIIIGFDENSFKKALKIK